VGVLVGDKTDEGVKVGADIPGEEGDGGLPQAVTNKIIPMHKTGKIVHKMDWFENFKRV
jgi:hypothetical protein